MKGKGRKAGQVLSLSFSGPKKVIPQNKLIKKQATKHALSGRKCFAPATHLVFWGPKMWTGDKIMCWSWTGPFVCGFIFFVFRTTPWIFWISFENTQESNKRTRGENKNHSTKTRTSLDYRHVAVSPRGVWVWWKKEKEKGTRHKFPEMIGFHILKSKLFRPENSKNYPQRGKLLFPIV